MSHVSRFTVHVLCAVLCLFFVLPALAQTGTVTDDQVNAVAKELNCPVCENIPLDVCETQACIQWRDLIRQKLQAGETPEQIIAYFHETYGDRVLQEPPKRGFTGVLWLLPLVGIVAGAILFWLALRSMSPGQRAAAAPQPANKAAAPPSVDGAQDDDDYRRRLERELEESK